MDIIPGRDGEPKALSAEMYAEVIAIARAERHKAIAAFWRSVFGGLARLGTVAGTLLRARGRRTFASAKDAARPNGAIQPY